MVKVSLQAFERAGAPFRAHHLEFDTAADLGDGEALVAINLATICGSDIHTIEGKRKEETPCILGHEAVGTVISCKRPTLSTGDRVTWTIADSCGRCAPCCDHDLPQKCEQLFKYGHAALTNGSGLNGCYASHVVLRAGTHIVQLPDDVTDAMAAPANCALATMVYAVDQWHQHRTISQAAGPGPVVVQGGGLLGIYGCALLRELGCPVVYCVEVDRERFGLIEQFGGIPIDGNGDASDQILGHCPGGVDAVFEVAGSKELLPQGVRLLRVGGFFGWIGLVHPDSAIDVSAEQVIRKCLTLRGIHNYRPVDLDSAIAFLRRNIDRLPFEALVSPPQPLAQLDSAIELAQQRNFMRVSVAP